MFQFDGFAGRTDGTEHFKATTFLQSPEIMKVI